MAIQTATKPEGPTGESKSDVLIDDTPPSAKMLDRAGALMVLDADKKKYSFKSLYEGKGRVLVVFLRHFFCGNCQEYTRTLSTDLPPAILSALPTPTSLILIGCGSTDLIPFYKRETNTPFPIYAEPTGKLYEVLGMTKTLSLGDKAPQYMRQSLYKLAFKSFIQELRSGRNILSGGDFFQVGGEFVFQSDGSISWCHRMKNTRDHAELDELRKALQMGSEPEPAATVALGKPIGSRRSMSGAGLVRKLSDRRKSWRNSMSRNRFRNTEANGSIPHATMEKLKEEDGAPEGDRDAALAKLTRNANENADLPHSNGGVPGGRGRETTADGALATSLANGTTTSAEDQATVNESAAEPSASESAAESGANSSADKPKANGFLGNSTPFVQSLMNGSIEKKSSSVDNSATGPFEKIAAAEATEDANGTLNGMTNGHIAEA